MPDFADIRTAISKLMGAEGLDQLLRILYADLFGLDSRSRPVLSEDQAFELKTACKRIADGEPLQYVTGKAWFYERAFRVDSRVLIPRPETEELCERIISRHANTSGRILDIGTGSGCIALTLALELPEAEVHATDLSGDAIELARLNAAELGAAVRFSVADFHSDQPYGQQAFDIIVCNPPYIARSEWEQMDASVREHEPEMALYAPGEDPLGVYRRLAELGMEYLNSGGWLYLELNSLRADEIRKELDSTSYESIKLLKDMQGNDRMLEMRKP